MTADTTHTAESEAEKCVAGYHHIIVTIFFSVNKK
jgi:hypothetical protein